MQEAYTKACPNSAKKITAACWCHVMTPCHAVMERNQHVMVQILSHLGQVWVYASHKPELLTTIMMVFRRERPTFGDEMISIGSYCFQKFSSVNIEQQECCV